MFKYSLPGNKLKEKLVYNLESICIYKYVMKFCNLLIPGKNLVEQSKNLEPEVSDQWSDLLQKSDVILDQIKCVIDIATPDVLVEKLSEALHEKINPVYEKNLHSLLLLETKSCDSLEYLGRLINSIEDVFKSHWNSELFYGYYGYGRDPCKDIIELDHFVRCAAFTCVTTVLGVLLQIKLDSVDVTAEETKAWRVLFLKVSDVIKDYVKFGEQVYVNIPFILQMRSCIECVLDLFVAYPMEESVFLNELDKLNDCRVVYDSLIERMYANPVLTYSDLSDEDESIKKTVKVPKKRQIASNSIIRKMPVNHSWWDKFRENPHLYF